jgi:hypothetical protein
VIFKQEDLCEVVQHYFDTLFKNNSGIHKLVLNLIQLRVTEDDNHLLMASLTKIEFQQTLFQTHISRQIPRSWWLQPDILPEVLGTLWLDRGYFPSSLNETNICLIPNVIIPHRWKIWDLFPYVMPSIR